VHHFLVSGETFAASGTSPASVTNITGWNYVYENESPNENATQSRGLKTNGALYNGSGTSWSLDHTENYTYEALIANDAADANNDQ
jgi:hypothetical protein